MTSSVRSGVVSVASQGVSSASNLMLAFVVARGSTIAEYGTWAIAYAIYVLALGLSRATCSTPLLIEASGQPTPRTARRASVSSAVWFGMLVAVVGAVITVLFAGQQSFIVLSIVAFLPALLGHDALRYIYLQSGRADGALLMDALWLALALGGWAAVSVVGPPFEGEAVVSCAVWAGAGTVAFLVALGHQQLAPSLAWAVAHWRASRSASTRLGVESSLNTGLAGFLPMGLAALGGASVAGGVRAGQTMSGGISIFVLGLTPVMTVEARRRLVEQTRLMRVYAGWAAVVGSVSCVYALGLLLIPDSLGVHLLGRDVWEAFQVVLIPTAVQLVLRGVYTGAPITLRAAHELDRAMRLSMLNAPVMLVAPLLGAWHGGLIGAAWGLVVASGWASCTGLWMVATANRSYVADPE